MRTEQLQHFVAVARFGSFSQAAEHLHIAQPSVSQSIANLESDLNVKLFERSRSGIRLTPIGESLLPKAQNVLNMVEEIYDEVRAETDLVSGSLNIAAIPSMCNAYLSDVLSAFKKRHPAVRIEVREDGTNEITRDVAANRVDVGLISRLPEDSLDPRIEFHPLLTGTYMVYVGRHSSMPLRNPLPKEEILKQPLITLQSGYRQEDYLKRMLGSDELNVLLTLGYTEAAKKIISQGIAVGFYPDFSVRKDPYVLAGDIMAFDIEGNDVALRFGWIRARNQRLTVAAQRFIQVLREVVDGT